MNKITISGRIANDLVMRYTQNQKGYVAFNVAVPRKMTDITDFINVIAWDKKAEYLTNYTFKGKRILVNGRLEMIESEKDGHKRHNPQVVAEDVEIIDYIENNKTVNGNSNNTEYTADDTESIDWENTDFTIEVDNGIDF